MRHVVIFTLLFILPIQSVAQTKRWADRIMSSDAKIRTTAEAALVHDGARSLPLLRRFLNTDNDALHEETFEIIRQIGPPAIPLLLDLLRHRQVTFRRFAADAFIDLAPDSVSIQPALRRALRDDDSMVAADAARALGALRDKASPSVRALVQALSHKEPHVRIYAAEALASIGPKAVAATKNLARALSDPTPGVRWAAGEALGSIGPGACCQRQHRPHRRRRQDFHTLRFPTQRSRLCFAPCSYPSQREDCRFE